MPRGIVNRRSAKLEWKVMRSLTDAGSKHAPLQLRANFFSFPINGFRREDAFSFRPRSIPSGKRRKPMHKSTADHNIIRDEGFF